MPDDGLSDLRTHVKPFHGMTIRLIDHKLNCMKGTPQSWRTIATPKTTLIPQ